MRITECEIDKLILKDSQSFPLINAGFLDPGQLRECIKFHDVRDHANVGEVSRSISNVTQD